MARLDSVKDAASSPIPAISARHPAASTRSLPSAGTASWTAGAAPNSEQITAPVTA
jgi:hypothetical protein